MEWKAKWIWYPEKKTLPNSIMKFRKLIEIESKIIEAKAYISADSRYKLYINEKYVTRGPAPYDPRHMYYDVIDIMPYLRDGKNIIAILGYYIGISTNNYIRPHDLSTTAAILFQSRIKFENGKILEVASDKTWKVKRAKSWRSGTNACAFAIPQWNEVFDARLYDERWINIEFNDLDWKDASDLNIPPGKPTICAVKDDLNNDDPTVKESYAEMRSLTSLDERNIKFLNEEKVPAISLKAIGKIHWNTDPEDYFETYEKDSFNIIESYEINKNLSDCLKDLDLDPGPHDSSYVIVDFGKDLTGRPFFAVEATEGTIIEITTSEKVNNLFITPGERIPTWSRYICRDGYQEFELNDYFVFRYIQLMVRNTKDSLKFKFIDAKKQEYPFELRGSFKCSDDKISKLWNIGVNTIKILSQDIFISEARERQQYTGENAYGNIAIYYAFGEYKLIRKSLVELGYSQHPEGHILGCWPSGDRLSRIKEAILGYVFWKPAMVQSSLRWVISIWDYYLYSGDIELLIELYPKVMKIRKKFQALKSKSSSLINTSWDIDFWMDHVGFKHKNGLALCANCLYYGMLKTIASMAEEIGDIKYSNDIKGEMKMVKDELIKSHWSESKSAFVYSRPDNSEEFINSLSNAIALFFKIVPEGCEKNTARRLATDKSLISPSPPMIHYNYLALAEYDNGKYFLDELRTKWVKLPSVTENKTFPEVFDEDIEYLSSRTFVGAVSPSYILSGEVLGVKPLKAGFKRFIVAPKPGDLKWAKGDIPTPHGIIHVSWEVENGEIDIEVNASEKYELEKQYGTGINKKLIFYLRNQQT